MFAFFKQIYKDFFQLLNNLVATAEMIWQYKILERSAISGMPLLKKTCIKYVLQHRKAIKVGSSLIQIKSVGSFCLCLTFFSGKDRTRTPPKIASNSSFPTILPPSKKYFWTFNFQCQGFCLREAKTKKIVKCAANKEILGKHARERKKLGYVKIWHLRFS